MIAAESRRVQTLKPHVPSVLKKAYKAAVVSAPANRRAAPDPWEPLVNRPPEVSQETSLLQQCVYKLPNSKAERVLGYVPPVPFVEGMRRSVAWLKFAGYPVVS
jgi:nucleoside-diphosphate-sugar epimerase